MKVKHYSIGIMLIIIDQLSKMFFINKNYSIIPNFFNITYTENTGGAWGLGNRYVVLAMSVVIILALIIYLIKNESKIDNYTPYILIISGSIGNLIDRIFRGYVIDFIDINIFNFPIFNIADICIVIGIVLLAIEIVKKQVKR